MILDYMRQFTEKVILSIRAGETERENILHELEKLLNDRLDQASPEVIEYLQFLISVVRGEDIEDVNVEALAPDFKQIFGEVIQKIKGTDIKKNIKDITKQAIAASRGTIQKKKEVIDLIETILQNQPEHDSKSVVHYLQFLIATVKGEDTGSFIPGLDMGLRHIYNEVLEELIKPDMLSFFEKLTRDVFNASNFDNGVATVKARIDELLGGPAQPPREIADYLHLLLAVLSGKKTDELEKKVAGEFIQIFNSLKDEV